MHVDQHLLCVAALLSMVGGCEPANVDVLTNVEVTSLPQNTTTKLLHWGGAQPVGFDELSWFVGHLPEVETAPFDGTVLDLGVGAAWLDTELTEDSLRPAAELLRSAPFQRFTDNFQRLDSGRLDFHDDAGWARIAHNLALLSRVVRESGLRGFMFDPQQYADYTWSYTQLPTGKLSFPEESANTFQRGQQLMQALLEGYPALTLLETLGTSEVFREVCIAGARLEDSDYALLPAFLDGMQAARDEARSGAVLIDGFLPAYATRDPASYRVYHDLVHGDWQALQAHWFPGIVTYRWATLQSEQTLGESRWPDAPALLCTEAERQSLTRDVAASFAVMLDYGAAPNSNDFQTDPARFSENTHTPAAYTALLRSALRASDRYVWSWTTNLVWWARPDDARPVVPKEYSDAAALAREQAK